MSFGLGLASTADIYGPSAGATFFQAQEKAPSTASAIAASPGSPNAPTGGSSSLEQKNLFPTLQNVNPLLWAPIILGVIVLLKLFREWGTDKTHFSALKVDLYWFLMTTLGAALGIPLLKGLLNKYKVPGLTEYVNNA